MYGTAGDAAPSGADEELDGRDAVVN